MIPAFPGAPVAFPDEPHEAYAAFIAWLVDRRRARPGAWARERGQHVATVEAWAVRFAWVPRRDAYRAELEGLACSMALAEEIGAVRVRLDRRLASMAAAELARRVLVHRAAEARDAPGAIDLSAKDAAALARLAGEESAALAPATPPDTGEDFSSWSDEELEAYAKAQDTIEELRAKRRAG